MPDDLKRKKPEDPTRISLDEPWEVAYWTRELGVSESTLRQAIRAVGNSTAKVRSHLGKK